MHGGSCLCGAIRYTVAGTLRPAIACHCRQCRKTSGHYFFAEFQLRGPMRIKGETRWHESRTGARRGLCPDCGSSLCWDSPARAMPIHAGSLGNPSGQNIAEHIIIADKSDHHEIADGHRQAANPDPELTTMVP